VTAWAFGPISSVAPCGGGAGPRAADGAGGTREFEEAGPFARPKPAASPNRIGATVNTATIMPAAATELALIALSGHSVLPAHASEVMCTAGTARQIRPEWRGIGWCVVAARGRLHASCDGGARDG